MYMCGKKASCFFPSKSLVISIRSGLNLISDSLYYILRRLAFLTIMYDLSYKKTHTKLTEFFFFFNDKKNKNGNMCDTRLNVAFDY